MFQHILLKPWEYTPSHIESPDFTVVSLVDLLIVVSNKFLDSEQIIKSKHRVKQHGEVFTPQWMIDLMLDIPAVREAAETIDKTFLEPAAGDGNFLVAIIERKLQALADLNLGDAAKTESLWALASVYGIELLEDNHELAQARVLMTFCKWWEEQFEEHLDMESDYFKSAEYIVNRNIVRGNTLTCRHPDFDEPIILSEWIRQKDSLMIGCRKFKFQDLFDEKIQSGEFGLFDDNFDVIKDDEIQISQVDKVYLQEV